MTRPTRPLDEALREVFAHMLDDEFDVPPHHSTARYVKREVSAVENMIRTARRWGFDIQA